MCFSAQELPVCCKALPLLGSLNRLLTLTQGTVLYHRNSSTLLQPVQFYYTQEPHSIFALHAIHVIVNIIALYNDLYCL